VGRPLETAWVRELTGGELAEYRSFVLAARGGHYVQLPAWDAVTRSVRKIATRYLLVRRREESGELRLIGAARVTRPVALALPLPVGAVERGPVVADLADLPAVIGALASTAARHGIARLTAMPYWADDEAQEATRILAESGWKDAQEADGAHARTLRLPLAASTDAGEAPVELFAGKEREALRRKLRQAEKAGATVRQGGAEAIEPLHALHTALMTGQGKHGRPRAYFEALHQAFVEPGDGAFFLAEHQGETLAALFVVRHGAVATFVLGASSGVERSFSKMAPPMAAAARWAREQGCSVFDLGGIPAPGDADEKRASIAQFKLDFAKTPVTLAHEHARAMVPGLP
jgi:lipid II:glycine glycyltransferase (peptidoglycan interpeptide bridge formation enzyme)